LYYFPILFQVFGFWIFAAVAGLVIVTVEYVKTRAERNLFLLLWLGIPILIITIVQTKIPWYVVPSYPTIAILAGRTLGDFTRRRGILAHLGALATFAGFADSFPMLALGVAVTLLGYFLLPLRKTSSSIWRTMLHARRLIPFLLVGLILLAGLRTFQPPGHGPDAKAMGLVVKEVVPETTLLVLYQMQVNRLHTSPSLVFYSDHLIVDVWESSELEKIL
jgi:hypothetical protein